jgi:hypothetical protein
MVLFNSQGFAGSRSCAALEVNKMREAPREYQDVLLEEAHRRLDRLDVWNPATPYDLIIESGAGVIAPDFDLYRRDSGGAPAATTETAAAAATPGALQPAAAAATPGASQPAAAAATATPGADDNSQQLGFIVAAVLIGWLILK